MVRQCTMKYHCIQDWRLKDPKVFIWPLFIFSQIAYNKQLHKFLIYMAKETSINTICGRWHGSYLLLYYTFRKQITLVIMLSYQHYFSKYTWVACVLCKLIMLVHVLTCIAENMSSWWYTQYTGNPITMTP